ncbi:MAG: NAD-dependent epimerase/dehydratase family protein [Methylocystaceae bacterium]|nr:NAD-dependent epimerase/dehydratase family protein [Methylocystaceae bacterium]
MPENWSIEKDFESVVEGVGSDWLGLKDGHLFITGGTGFIGRWLLETLKLADLRYTLNLRASVLTRNPENFAKKAPDLFNAPIFTLIAGDVQNFNFPEGDFTHLIHAATDASAELNARDPRLMFDTVLNGTRRALDFAVEKKISRILNLSSGAVYGPQPFNMEYVKEDWFGAPDCRRAVNAYGEGKRAAEMLCAIYEKQFGLSVTTARIFALLGPYLSIDTHFAAGNFIRDAIAGKKIIVQSSGSAVRSYLYVADLTEQLWRLLLRGEAGHAYNLGSSEGISIKDLAEKVATLLSERPFGMGGSLGVSEAF